MIKQLQQAGMHERMLKLPSSSKSNLGTWQVVMEDTPAEPASLEAEAKRQCEVRIAPKNVALNSVWHTDKLRALAKISSEYAHSSWEHRGSEARFSPSPKTNRREIPQGRHVPVMPGPSGSSSRV